MEKLIECTVDQRNVLAEVKEMLAELTVKLVESSAEFDKRSAEFNQKLEASRADWERRSADWERRTLDWERRSTDLDRQLKKLGEQVGGWGNNHGSFAEEYFVNSFINGNRTFFGEKFDEYENNLKGIERGYKDEYDFVFFNGKSVGIVEVKFKARDKDITDVLNKVNTFRVNFPKYQHHRFYLGLAALTFEKQVEQNCVDHGIAVIKQVGDTVVINDRHLKVF